MLVEEGMDKAVVGSDVLGVFFLMVVEHFLEGGFGGFGFGGWLGGDLAVFDKFDEGKDEIHSYWGKEKPDHKGGGAALGAKGAGQDNDDDETGRVEVEDFIEKAHE